MSSNCGGSLSLIVPTTIAIPKLDTYYGKPNMYCRWQILTQFPDVLITFDKMVKMIGDKHTLQIVYNRKETEVVELEFDNYTLLRDDVDKIFFHYSSPHDKIEAPFLLSITTQAVEVDYIYLIIFLVSAIGSCFVCTCVFYKCSKMIIDNNNRRLNEIARGNLDEINNLDAPTNRQLVVSSLERKVELIHKNLKPHAYDAKKNQYGSNCTICLEEYKSDESVCVLKCNHIFHETCIRDFFKKNINSLKCPNCNKELEDSIDTIRVEENQVNSVLVRNNGQNNQVNNFMNNGVDSRLNSPERTRQVEQLVLNSGQNS